MARSPVLRTPRLSIEPFSDVRLSERYVSWLNDPEVVRFSENRHRRHTIASCREYAASFNGTPNYFWAIVARDPEVGHIGNMNAYVSAEHALADVGIVLGERSIWGRGYGIEAWLAVCDFLLRTQALRKVSAGALSTNRAMLSIMRRTEMQLDGVRVAHYLVEGNAGDLVHMALFHDAWVNRFPYGPFEAIHDCSPQAGRAAVDPP